MPAVVDEEKCIGCQTCVDVCPSAAISMKDNEKAFINPDECVECETCVDECPESAIHME